MANSRHTRDTDARSQTPDRSSRTPRRPSRATMIATPLAVLATAATVAVGVAGPEASHAPAAASGSLADSPVVLDRREPVSRAGGRSAARSAARSDALQRAFDRNARVVATRAAVEAADERRWTTAPLNLWTLPGKEGRKVGVLAEEVRVLVTGRGSAKQVEVVVDGRSRWVTGGYLALRKPVEEVEVVEAEPETEAHAEEHSEEAAAATAKPAGCTNGTSVSPGVSPNVEAVHEAVCAAFPEITSYGDFRGDGEHAEGRALDVMVSGDRGWEVAEYLRANYADLGIEYLIFSQRIWSVDRGGEGWRSMEDRGSTTANHYDHVHVTTY